MSIENGPEKILPKRQLISLVKEYDDLIAESGVAEWADEARASLNQRINNQKEQLDAERMNYTNEQWGLLTQIATLRAVIAALRKHSFLVTMKMTMLFSGVNRSKEKREDWKNAGRKFSVTSRLNGSL